MRPKYFFALLALLCMSAQVVQADLYCDDFDDGTLDGWTTKIGSWSIAGASDKYLSNSGSVYGVIWKDDTLGVNQKITVDAFFDLSASVDDQIAHLRLRTGDTGSPNQFWDTGYLADVQPGHIYIQNTYLSGNPVVAQYVFSSGTSPINASGWYTLTFEVTGTGSDTHFDFLINGTSYIDQGYNNTIAALDQGYIGLGRKIKYDNFCGAVDVAPVPAPAAVLLGILGLTTAAAKLRRRREA